MINDYYSDYNICPKKAYSLIKLVEQNDNELILDSLSKLENTDINLFLIKLLVSTAYEKENHELIYELTNKYFSNKNNKNTEVKS